ncbi:hypothetical protein GJAV_G00106140 [Gymnothorax javanicus]|nr:hypothetical protein GJAV_G00106140 [Gymnothorax javanicus]
MSALALLSLVLCVIHREDAASHSLKYLYTAVTLGIELPEFTAVGTVDDVQFMYYDGNIRRMIPKTEWIKESEGADYWRRETLILMDQQQFFSTSLRIMMAHFHQTEGVHTLQNTFGCEWDDETNTIERFDQYGYDGEDFIILNTKFWSFIPLVPEANFLIEKWDDASDQHEHRKQFLTHECVERLQKYVRYGNSSLERTVPPQVSLLQKSLSSPVTCHVTGFYPRNVMVTWQKDGQELDEDVELEDTVPNGDGTFQTRSHLRVNPEDWKRDRYTCTVQHKSLEQDIILPVTEGNIRRNMDIKSETEVNLYKNGTIMVQGNLKLFEIDFLLIKERAQQERSSSTDSSQTLPDTHSCLTTEQPPEEKEPTSPEHVQDPQLNHTITDLKVKFTDLERELVQLRELISQQPCQPTTAQPDPCTIRTELDMLRQDRDSCRRELSLLRTEIRELHQDREQHLAALTALTETSTSPHSTRPAQQRRRQTLSSSLTQWKKFLNEKKLFPTHNVAKIWCPNTHQAIGLLSEERLGSPSHIIIHTGTNDLRSQQERVSEALNRVIEKASTTFPSSRVVISTLLPRKDFHPDTIHRINSSLSRDCARRPNVHLAHHPTLDISCLYDHVHLFKNTVPIFAQTLKNVALNRDQSTAHRKSTSAHNPHRTPRHPQPTSRPTPWRQDHPQPHPHHVPIGPPPRQPRSASSQTTATPVPREPHPNHSDKSHTLAH